MKSDRVRIRECRDALWEAYIACRDSRPYRRVAIHLFREYCALIRPYYDALLGREVKA